jgi:hypothetical protein
MAYTFSDVELGRIFVRRQSGPDSDQPVGKPVEQGWKRSKWYWIFNRSNIDLAVAAVLYIALVLLAITVIWKVTAHGTFETAGIPIIFSAAVFGTFVELIRRVYDTAIGRLAIIDLFTSEMLSILRIFAAANIIGDFVRLYDRLANGPALSDGFADTARKENYFNIFEHNSSALGSLNPAAVNDLVAFYTFMRASRDATGAMKQWKEPYYDTTMKKNDIISIIFLCFLMTTHGREALMALVTTKDNKDFVDDIFAGVILQCFAFLYHVLPRDDFRWPRIEQRSATCREMRAKHGYDLKGAWT